jgi:hypothetical protein
MIWALVMPGLWAAGERGGERGIPHRKAAGRSPQALPPRSIDAGWCRLVRAANRSSPRTHLIAIALSSPGHS